MLHRMFAAKTDAGPSDLIGKVLFAEGRYLSTCIQLDLTMTKVAHPATAMLASLSCLRTAMAIKHAEQGKLVPEQNMRPSRTSIDREMQAGMPKFDSPTDIQSNAGKAQQLIHAHEPHVDTCADYRKVQWRGCCDKLIA